MEDVKDDPLSRQQLIEEIQRSRLSEQHIRRRTSLLKQGPLADKETGVLANSLTDSLRSFHEMRQSHGQVAEQGQDDKPTIGMFDMKPLSI